jgi:Site-specific recombinase XerD
VKVETAPSAWTALLAPYVHTGLPDNGQWRLSAPEEPITLAVALRKDHLGQWQLVASLPDGTLWFARSQRATLGEPLNRHVLRLRFRAGHASLLTTSVYLHVAVEDEGKVGDLFCFVK